MALCFILLCFMRPFNYDLDFKTINFRDHPELYTIGKGEQGVLLVEPYKSEILPHWRFKDPGTAAKSSKAIYALFEAYKIKRFCGYGYGP